MDSKDREYTNGEITVYWRPKKCIHATTCYKELIEVFNPRNRPWVNMSGAPTDRIIEVVNKCPTEALFFKYNNEIDEKTVPAPSKPKQDETKTQLKVMKDGPLVVRGKFTLTGENGEQLKVMKLTSLCRCGGSNKMPFCDGTHRKIGFEGEQTELKQMEEKENKEATEITIMENGPMVIEGDFEFVNAQGEKMYLGKKVYLCRCGNSTNMPFCDKTNHAKCFT